MSTSRFKTTGSIHERLEQLTAILFQGGDARLTDEEARQLGRELREISAQMKVSAPISSEQKPEH